jgi:hypothetical protein
MFGARKRVLICMDRYELIDQQEKSAQHHVRWPKAFYASLAIGALFLMLPRAVPWFSSGIPETAMGRPLNPISDLSVQPFVLIGMLHMLLAICYGLILAMLIFRFKVKVSVALGALIGLGLYGLNFALFRLVLGTPPANEFQIVITHVFFSMIFSAAYKALSIPDADQVA